MPEAQQHEPVDALDTIQVQDEIIADLLGKWRDATATLREGDDVNVRWERGSAAKLVLQHFAVRESAKQALAGALREREEVALADKVEGDGVRRREAIDRLDETVRGRQAITLNNPDVDHAVEALGELFDRERDAELADVLPRAEALLGPAGERDLPSARHVRTHAPTHPSPVPKWHDKVGPLKAVRALYDHLRGTPTGGTSPSVDEGREHLPGEGT